MAEYITIDKIVDENEDNAPHLVLSNGIGLFPQPQFGRVAIAEYMYNDDFAEYEWQGTHVIEPWDDDDWSEQTWLDLLSRYIEHEARDN